MFHSVIGSSFYVSPLLVLTGHVSLEGILQATVESQIRQTYGVNANVASLGLTLYVLGFAVGPLICAYSSFSHFPAPNSLYSRG